MKTYYVQLVKTIYVLINAESEEQAAEKAKQDSEGFAYDGHWAHAKPMAYDISEQGVYDA